MNHDVTIICGPTGIGKSSYALALAEQGDAEIVSADSQQVYVGCDIGTGKVSAEERARVPHHCLDVCEPDQAYDAYQYVSDARAAIADIHARGKRALVVGGTGLYVKALMWGVCDVPARDAAVRAELEAIVARDGSAALHAQLAEVDPELAGDIHPNHSSRIVRALEVQRLTGRSIRSFHDAHRCEQPYYPNAQWIQLHCDRPLLRERIRLRVAQQMADGWVDEVVRLYAQYGADIPIFRAIGYRELLGAWRDGDVNDAVIERIVLVTGQYAKRQETYLRGLTVDWSAMIEV